ncbi:MAG: hypothetical protein ABR615_05885 [Pseudonocardiaceae bacterium]
MPGSLPWWIPQSLKWPRPSRSQRARFTRRSPRTGHCLSPTSTLRLAYVVNNGSNTISVIDATTNRVTATIPTGPAQRGTTHCCAHPNTPDPKMI